MKPQPGHIGYFFGAGYEHLTVSFKSFWSSQWDNTKRVLRGIQIAWRGDKVMAVVKTLLLSFSAASLLICGGIFGTLFFLLHFFILSFITLLASIAFIFVAFLDSIYRGIHGVSSSCPNCQNKLKLPVYKCQSCSVDHTQLIPSRYGILYRRCRCGAKLSTTFFNGRQKLKSFCPVCGYNIVGGGHNIDILIPVIGGPSAGKTCYITTAISRIEANASKYKLEFQMETEGKADYQRNKTDIINKQLPQKTSDRKLAFYQFRLSNKKAKVKNLISLCDVAGEVYEDDVNLSRQIGYKNAEVFLMIIDPLSIAAYSEELKAEGVDIAKYGKSDKPIDEILSLLLSTIRNIAAISNKKALDVDLAIVFTKIDIPNLKGLIGDSARRQFAKRERCSELEAQNLVCEKFLKNYGESNFVNMIKSNFKSVQYFTCSALGHVANSTPFESVGVEDPLLWLIDKASKSIDLKEKWGKTI